MAVLIFGPGNDVAQGTKKADQALLGAGSDAFFGNGGRDTIFGDKADVVAFVGPNTDPVDIIFDDDNVLNGEGGNDVIYGDTAEVQMVAEGVVGSSIVTVSSKTFKFGSESPSGGPGTQGLFGEGGNDILYGDLAHLSMIATAASNEAMGDLQGGASILTNTIEFGDDLLVGGRGKDSLYGDLQMLETKAVGGSDVVTGPTESVVAQASIAGNSYAFGADELNGGAGSDILLGDLEAWFAEAVGGDRSSGGLESFRAFIINETLVFGVDSLDGGANSDTVYGDLINIEWTAEGGLSSGVSAGFGRNAFIVNNEITFGDDTMNGGDASDV